MKYSLFILVLFFVATSAFAQQWKPSVLTLERQQRFDDIYMLNRDTGLLVSYDGKIYKTYDGAQLCIPNIPILKTAILEV